MLIGDPAAWVARFRGVEQRLIDQLPTVWPICTPGLTGQSLEDEITRRLVLHLRKDPVSRTLGTILSQLELLEEQCRGDVVPKGYIDMAIVLDEDPECYVAFECKRLNVIGKNRTVSLAGPYVKEGMLRYVHAKYARDLTLGAMIGYVMDGNMSTAEKRVCRAIDSRSKLLYAATTPVALAAAPVGFVRRLTSLHVRPGETSTFEIRHSLLPVL